MTEHKHDHCEIMYVVSGECKISADRKDLFLHQNQFVFLDEGVTHRLLVDTACYMMNLEFSYNKPGIDISSLWTGFREAELFFRDTQPVKKIYDNAFVGRAMRDLIVELEHGRESYPVGLLFQRLMVELSRCKETYTPGIHYLRLARNYMEGHFDEEIRVADVAEAAGISPAYLETLFAKYENTSVINIIRNMRLDKACVLLRETRQSITDIAFACGYNSRQQFGYSFLKRYGQSPREYRNIQGV